MANFIKIHNKIINVESISKVEFVSDDVYLGLFPKDKENKIIVDMIPFTFAKVELLTGEEMSMDIDLYPPEEGESEEDWIARNRAYINKSMYALEKALGGVTTVTGFEYENC